MEPYSSTPSPCEHTDYYPCHLAVLLWKIFCPVLLVVGLVGNSIAIAVWSRKRMRFSTTSLYLRFLAIVDTAVLVVAPLRELVFYSSGTDIQVINDFSCRFHSWLVFTVTALSAWILAAISIDRLILVKFPLWAKVNCSKKSVVRVFIILTLLIGFINTHMLIYLEKVTIYTLNKHTNKSVVFDEACLPHSNLYKVLWHSIWPVAVLILYSIGPRVCLTVCGIMLIKSLSMRNASLQSSIQLRPQKAEQTRSPTIKQAMIGLSLVDDKRQNEQQNPANAGTSQSIKEAPREKDTKSIHNEPDTKTETHVQKTRQTTNQPAQNKSQHHRDLRPLTKVMIAVCLFFLVCTLPVCIFLILERVFYDVNIPKDLASRRLALAIVALILYCNNAFNCVIYCLSSKVYRHELANLFQDIRSNFAKRFQNEVAPQSTQIGHSRSDNVTIV